MRSKEPDGTSTRIRTIHQSTEKGEDPSPYRLRSYQVSDNFFAYPVNSYHHDEFKNCIGDCGLFRGSTGIPRLRCVSIYERLEDANL
jgi:hypothetical protein